MVNGDDRNNNGDFNVEDGVHITIFGKLDLDPRMANMLLGKKTVTINKSVKKVAALKLALIMKSCFFVRVYASKKY